MRNHNQDPFDEALKRWGGRSPRTPAEEAARRVMANVPERRSGTWFTGTGRRLATASVGLALLLVVGWMTLPHRSSPLPRSQEIALPPLSEDVVLLWLDDETPLYLTVAPPAAKGDS